MVMRIGAGMKKEKKRRTMGEGISRRGSCSHEHRGSRNGSTEARSR